MRLDLRKSLFILPNLFTLSNIFCGFYAAILAAQADSAEGLRRAALLIIFAMFLDILDGRVARLTRTQSAFGVQIDSLADVVSFGVAPAVLVHRWSLERLGDAGLLIAFLFLAAGAIRLARFNVLAMRDSGDSGKPGKYISGLPIPGAAGMVVSMVVADFAVEGKLSGSPALVAVIVTCLGVFMVSTIQFRSFKDLRLNLPTMLLIGFALASSAAFALLLHPVFALVWLLVSYLAIGLAEATRSLARRVRHRLAGGDRESHGFLDGLPDDEDTDH